MTNADKVFHGFLKFLNVLFLVLKAFVLCFVPKRLRYKDITGQVILITGGGSGIGRLLALDLASRGGIVVIWDVHKGREETVRLIGERGDIAYSYHCDVSKKENVYATAEKVQREVGQVDILVNNAGILIGNDFLKLEDAAIEKVFAVNALAPMWTCKAFLPGMIERSRGHLVTISSMGGHLGSPQLSDYCATKHAVKGFHESLQMELLVNGHHDIQTTLICPTFFSSGFYAGLEKKAFSPEMTPDYVARKISEAVLTDQQVAIVPPVLSVIVVLKSLLPNAVTIRLLELAGNLTMTKNLRGRPEFFQKISD